MRTLNRCLCIVALLWNQEIACGELTPYDGLLARPVLELPDLAGKRQTLEAHRGSVVLLNFWASWCAPCLVEMPGMQRLLDRMAGRPFIVLAVNVGESREKAWRFINLLDVDFVTLLDSSGSAAKAWDVQVYPTSFLIDAGGNVRYTAYGAIEWDSEKTRQLIEQLMPHSQSTPMAEAATTTE